MAERSKEDWESIEKDYRSGVLSIKEIARNYGCSDTAIRKKAKAKGWARDLSRRVSERVRAKLVCEPVRDQAENQKLEEEIVEQAAEKSVEVVKNHRSKITRSQKVWGDLLDELESQTVDRELYQNLGEMMRNPEARIDKLNDLYHKVISTPSRVDSMKKMTDALKTLIGAERQAYNLDEPVQVQVNQTNAGNDVSPAVLEVLKRVKEGN